jgi:heat shock protein HslJ
VKSEISMKRISTILFILFLSTYFISCSEKTVTWQEIQDMEEDVPFYNTLWRLEYYNGKIPREKSNITFRKYKKCASGKAACNGYSANYELGAAGNISIKVREVTKKHCGYGGALYERDYLHALNNVTSYDIKGEYLILFSLELERGLRFRAYKGI